MLARTAAAALLLWLQIQLVADESCCLVSLDAPTPSASCVSKLVTSTPGFTVIVMEMNCTAPPEDDDYDGPRPILCANSIAQLRVYAEDVPAANRSVLAAMNSTMLEMCHDDMYLESCMTEIRPDSGVGSQLLVKVTFRDRQQINGDGVEGNCADFKRLFVVQEQVCQEEEEEAEATDALELQLQGQEAPLVMVLGAVMSVMAMLCSAVAACALGVVVSDSYGEE